MEVALQWGRERLQLHAGAEEDVEGLRARVYSLTNVLPERQKLFFKGRLLKEGSLAANGLVSPAQVMLMGKAEGAGASLAQRVAAARVVFAEDLSAPQRAAHHAAARGEAPPVGLHNLGNTCYVNAVAQLLHGVPELREALRAHAPTQPSARAERVLLALRALFERMDGAGESFGPAEFLQGFFDGYPQFAERDEEGQAFKQQDAEEALSLLLADLSAALPALVERLFAFALTTVSEGAEGAERGSQPGADRKLSCIIDNEMNPISQLADGLRLGLRATVSKSSALLGRDALFSQTSWLEGLPAYLLVQQIRFVWREKDLGSNTEARKVKILRAVAFPPTLDLSELCSEGLRARLAGARQAEAEAQRRQRKSLDEQFEEYKRRTAGEEDSFKLFRAFKERQAREEAAREGARVWRPHGGEGDTGHYALVGVITHQGRSADRGHYVAWLRGRDDGWHKYDDEEVTRVEAAEILNLKGGGDWHTAYLLLYRRLQFLPADARD